MTNRLPLWENDNKGSSQGEVRFLNVSDVLGPSLGKLHLSIMSGTHLTFHTICRSGVCFILSLFCVFLHAAESIDYSLPGPAYPFLWGHPVVPIYWDISKNRHIAAYGKGANIAFFFVSAQNRKELHDVNFLLGNER